MMTDTVEKMIKIIGRPRNYGMLHLHTYWTCVHTCILNNLGPTPEEKAEAERIAKEKEVK